MKCQRCSGPTRVPTTREVELGDGVVRIRECRSRACGYVFVTMERPIDGPPPAVVAVAMEKRNRRQRAAPKP